MPTWLIALLIYFVATAVIGLIVAFVLFSGSADQKEIAAAKQPLVEEPERQVEPIAEEPVATAEEYSSAPEQRDIVAEPKEEPSNALAEAEVHLAAVEAQPAVEVAEKPEPAETEAPAAVELPKKPEPPPALPTKSCMACGVNTEGGGIKLQRCSRCQNVYFCSRKCQAEAWPTHKNECKPSKAVQERAELKTLERKQQELYEEGFKAMQTNELGENRRAAKLLIEAACMCVKRREKLTVGSDEGKQAYLKESELHGLAAQCYLRLQMVKEASKEAEASVAAAKQSGSVARTVESTAAMVLVLLRGPQDGWRGAKVDLENSIASCIKERKWRKQMSKKALEENKCDEAATYDPEGDESCTLLCAEAVARSALMRVLFALNDNEEDEDGAQPALDQITKGVALRREHLRIREKRLLAITNPHPGSHYTKEATVARAECKEAQRQLSSTLINYAGMLTGHQKGENGANRKAYEEALSYARLCGDGVNEQAALSNLVNLTDDKEEVDENKKVMEVRALKEVLAKQRKVGGSKDDCMICYEKLGEKNLVTHAQCGALFHRHCMTKWMEQSPKCPNCNGYAPAR